MILIPSVFKGFYLSRIIVFSGSYNLSSSLVVRLIRDFKVFDLHIQFHIYLFGAMIYLYSTCFIYKLAF